MKKYRVMGTTTVTVYKEVWATNEEDAIDKVSSQLDGLGSYCGNFGYDKLVGVEGDGESVSADGYIEWDYNFMEMLEHDPDYFECPDCNEECERTIVNGEEAWHCSDCDIYYDEDGYEIYPEEEEK